MSNCDQLDLSLMCELMLNVQILTAVTQNNVLTNRLITI